jgi:glycosyltransferase involved in cell wall biosynthesis
MRIAVSIKSTTFHKGFGGLETQNKALCEGLAQKGHEIVVFTPKNGLSDTQKSENDVNYRFISCNKPRFSFLTKWQANSWDNRLTQAFAEEHQKTCFQLFISQSSSGVAVIRQKAMFEIPVLSVIHGTKMGEFQTRLNSISSPKEFFQVFLDLPHVLLNFFTVQRHFIHGSDKIVAVSSAVKKGIIEETFVDENKIVVINNGIKVDGLSSNENVEPEEDIFDDSKVTLLYIGQILKEKGLGILVDIMSDERFDNFKLITVGGGPYLEELKEKVNDLGLSSRFVIKGKVSYARVMHYYTSAFADIFVFPTKRVEGFPMVLVEAMLASLPVVAFNMGGVGDAVINGETGYVVQAGDIETFKKRLLELGSNEVLRKKLGENARIKAQSEFTVEKMLEKYEQLIMEVIK